MIPQIMTRLRTMRLTGMADALAQQQEEPGTYDELSFAERLTILVNQEETERNNKRLARLLRSAR